MEPNLTDSEMTLVYGMEDCSVQIFYQKHKKDSDFLHDNTNPRTPCFESGSEMTLVYGMEDCSIQMFYQKHKKNSDFLHGYTNPRTTCFESGCVSTQ